MTAESRPAPDSSHRPRRRKDQRARRVAEGVARDLVPQTVVVVGGGDFGAAVVDHLREGGVEAVAARGPDDVSGPGTMAEAKGGAAGDRRSSTLVLWLDARCPSDLDLDAAAARLAEVADVVLVDRAPALDADPTGHFPPRAEGLAAAFARANMVRDVDIDATWVSPRAACFKRLRAGWPGVVAAYERRQAILQGAGDVRRRLLEEQQEEMARRWQRARSLTEALQDRDRRLAEAEARATDLTDRATDLARQVAALEAWREALLASPAWRVTSLLQRARAAAAPPGSRREELAVAAARAPGIARAQGVRSAVRGVWVTMRPGRGVAVEVVPVAPRPGP
ncbi:MAG: hypothetical protein ACE5EL_05130, partial [Anaerolineae bacterium]